MAIIECGYGYSEFGKFGVGGVKSGEVGLIFWKVIRSRA